jgi:hypothetical protein
MTTRKHDQLLQGFLERVSWRVLDEYRDILRGLIRGKCGVYALYRQDKLYYVGLASNLMGRVDGHLRDRHKGAWDRFSVYLTNGSSSLKPLESLLLRIAKPSGNRVSGGFGRKINMHRSLYRAMSEADADKRASILGGRVAQHLRHKRTRGTKGSLVLAGLVERRIALRGRLKGKEFRATLRRDGYISFLGQKFESPTGAAKQAVRRTVNGWVFWHYRAGPGQWVPLSHLRRR